MQLLEMFITVLCAVIASSGFWLYMQKRLEKKDARTKLLIALAHNTIVQQCFQYLDKGEITMDQLENLEQLVRPYLECDDEDGTIKMFMGKVERECQIVPSRDDPMKPSGDVT